MCNQSEKRFKEQKFASAKRVLIVCLSDEIWLFQRPYQQLFHKLPFEVGFHFPVSDKRSCYGCTVHAESENRLKIITRPVATGYLHCAGRIGKRLGGC